MSPGKVKKLRERTNSDKVILIPNGIDEAFLDDETGKPVDLRPYGIDGAEPFCVYAGNIGLAQGLDTLLDMAKERPGIQFAIFGNGADRLRLEKRVANESLFNVRFCGSVDFPVIRAALSSATFSYVPLVSSRLKDSIPTKLYESLACGCPVLLAAEGDSTELLDESKLGMHAPPENLGALLERLDLLVDRHFTDAERRNASQWVLREHSRQRFAEDFVRKVEELFNWSLKRVKVR